MTRALYTCIYVYMCAFDIGACARSRICVHVDALSRSLPQDTGVTRVATAHHDESGARGGGGLRHHTPTGSDQRYEECVKRGVSKTFQIGESPLDTFLIPLVQSSGRAVAEPSAAVRPRLVVVIAVATLDTRVLRERAG